MSVSTLLKQCATAGGAPKRRGARPPGSSERLFAYFPLWSPTIRPGGARTIESLRKIWLAVPGASEDVKWGHDLCFSVGGKMYAAVNLDPPHQVSFKCTPEIFAELTEREGIIPAPYATRHMLVQEEKLGTALERREVETLIRRSYELVAARLPKSKQPGAGVKAGSRSILKPGATVRRKRTPAR